MATYTFEHINRSKGFHVKADTRNLLDGRERGYPADNYHSGDGKSRVWSGHGYYVQHNRDWKKHHEVLATPGLHATGRIPDLLEFQDEDTWREFQRKRDMPGSGKYCASSGFRYSGHPKLQLNGYAFNPFNLYRTGIPPITMYNAHHPWPKTEMRTFPSWRGPRGYYGYYHEELDCHHQGGYRYPRDPKVLVNDEDIMKYEYMRDMPALHDKKPVELPVLQ